MIGLICDVCGFESPSGSPVVVNVKKAIMKEANKGKKKAERIGMTEKKLEKIMEACYKEDFREVDPERRSAKRFNDIQKLKKEDI